MNKTYKGYELMKAIANKEIKEGSRFLDRTDTAYYDETSVHTFIYKNDNFIQEKVGGLNIVSILNHTFELINDEKEIDIQNIEEINLDFHKGYADIRKYLKEKGNEIIKALKQIDKNQKR